MKQETRYVRRPEGPRRIPVLGSGPRDTVFVPDQPNNIEITWEEPAVARFFERLAPMGRPRRVAIVRGRLSMGAMGLLAARAEGGR